MNESADELFEEFLNAQDESAFSKEKISTRNAIQISLSNLDYIIKLFDQSHVKAIGSHKQRNLKPFTGHDLDFVAQTRVHAESFYCEAHRLKKTMMEKGFKACFKSLKLRNLTFIRNHIIEHPCVDLSSSMWSGMTGIRMFIGGPIKPSNPEITDKGFYPNVIEFYEELTGTLKAAQR